MNVPHDVELLLDSYSKRCPDCRLAVAAIDEPRALQLLADEVSRAISGDLSRIRLNNAITIWQQAARRADKHGTGARR